MDTMAASSDYDPNTKKRSCNIGTMCRHLDLEWRPDRKPPVDQLLQCRGTAKDDSLAIGETLILLNRVRDVERELEERQLETAGNCLCISGPRLFGPLRLHSDSTGVDCPFGLHTNPSLA